MKTNILKYFVLSICSYLMLTNIVKAQPVHSYRLNVSTEKTYIPLTDAMVIAENISSPNIYEIIYQGSEGGKFQTLDTSIAFPIGFDFMLEGIPMNRFAVSTQGYLILGKDKVVSSGEDARFIQVRNGEGKRYMVGLNLEKRAYAHSETKISYKLEGTTPNRELVVEFSNLGYQSPNTDNSPPYDTVTFQIRLKESNNNILTCFKNFKYSNTYSSVDVWVGIKGGGDKENWVFANHATDWTKAIAGYNMGKLKWSPSLNPPNNLFYEFIYPNNCTTPIEQVSDLKLVPGSDYINLSYSKSSDADRYLLIRSLVSTLSAQPQDGMNYTAGDEIGGGEVLQFSTNTSYLDEELIPSTSYYYFVYATNYLCSQGPKYLIRSPLNGAQKTFSTASSIILKAADTNSITVELTQNKTQNQILLAITDLPLGFDVASPQEGGLFDVPSGSMQVGNIMPSGAKIIYKGSSKENVKIENLNPGTLYHFRVWSIENGDTSYSTLVTDVDTCTTPIIPYKMDFQKEVQYETPYGWTIKGAASTRIELIPKTSDQILHVNKGSATKGENTLMTPKILNSKKEKLRVNFDLNYTFYANRQDNPFLIWGEDSVLLQYSGDGENYTTFYIMDQKNRDSLKSATEYVFKRINLPEAAAALPEIYIRWKLINNTSVRFRFNNVLVESIPSCEYPTKLVFVDGSIKAMQGSFAWTANGEERFWNLRYREENSDTWSVVEQADANPFTMMNLKPNTFLQVQVQAVCSQENLSPWSNPTSVFQSGYHIPFIEQFNRSLNVLPLYWEVKAAVLSPDIKKDSLKKPRSSSWAAGSWKKEFKGDNAVLLEPGRVMDSSAWFLSPILDLGNTNENYVLDFDLALTRGSSSDRSTPDTVSKTLVLKLVISTDGGESFKAENTLKTWDSTNNTYLSIAGFQHNSIDLSAYRGSVQLAWYTENKDPSETSILYLDNIAFRPSCSPAQDLIAAGVGADSAYITWTSVDPNAAWLLRYAKEGESEYMEQEVMPIENQASVIIYNLLPQTDYTAYVSRICSEGDTAAWMPLEFTTASLVPCAVPTALTASNIGKTTTDLSWTATGLSYVIMFKNKTADQWIKTTSPISSIALKALSMGAEYEVKVQSTCSRASGDTSAYTDLYSFTTLEENCFAPENIRSTEVTHTTAILKWNGASSAYLVSYKSETSDIYINVNVSDTIYVLSNLSALTSYMVRIKSICSVSDTSAWSASYSFTTTDAPKCPPPTTLKTNNISAHEAELSWTKSEEHQNWVVRSRVSIATSWDTTSLISEANYKMGSLLPNTAYVWTVKAVCSSDLHSLWAGTQNFSTIPISIETGGVQDFKLYSENGQIHIINAEAYYIRSIDLIYPNGQIVKSYPIASDAHVSLSYEGKSPIIIVRINGKNDFKTYKIHCK